MMVMREFPKLPRFTISSPESSFRIPTDLLQALECPFGLRKDWHANRDKLRDSRRRTRNRENPSGQKSSHLFFVRRSLCQETPNKEGATVITPFLPPGFSRVSVRKTRQPEPSRSDPTRARHIKYSQEEGPRHISQGLTKFD
jgi:hypothetical protein